MRSTRRQPFGCSPALPQRADGLELDAGLLDALGRVDVSPGEVAVRGDVAVGDGAGLGEVSGDRRASLDDDPARRARRQG